MCQALQELDITSRAAESIVEDWQGPIVDESAKSESTQPSAYLVRLCWPLDQLTKLLLDGVGYAHRVREACYEINKTQAVDDGETPKVTATIQAAVDSINRLIKAIRITLSIIDVFKNQGLTISSASELEDCPAALSLIIDDVEKFSEDVSWEEINKHALPLGEFKALAAHLTETGKASA